MAWQELETTLPRSSKSVATTSWTVTKSRKVTWAYTDGNNFVIAQSMVILELMMINL